MVNVLFSEDSNSDEHNDKTNNRVNKLNLNLTELNLETELQNQHLEKSNTNYKKILKIVKNNINELKEAKTKDFSLFIWMIGFSCLFVFFNLLFFDLKL